MTLTDSIPWVPIKTLEVPIKGTLRSVLNEDGSPKFVPREELAEEMLDPDYGLNLLAKMNGGRYTITCSKCHHCR